MNRRPISFYFTDAIHFNKGSWRSLFLLMEEHSIPHRMNRENRVWQGCLGDYRSKRAELSSYLKRLPVEQGDLYQFEYCGTKLFPCIEAELLAYLLPKEAWRRLDVPVHPRAIFDLAWSVSRDDLLLNMAAGLYWHEYWRDVLPTIRKHTHAIVFSGSKSYAKIILQLLTKECTTPIVMEHSFTGNDFFFEERFSSLPNQSEIALDTVFSAYESLVHRNAESDAVQFAVDRLRQMKNKNVIQPNRSAKRIDFKNDRPTVLVIGQVVNDFSIIETSRESKSSIFLYTKLIKELLDATDCNIIFKAHPWERRKTHTEGRPLTLMAMKDFRDSLSFELADRVFLTENFNINQLFECSTYVATICSQAGLEAAFHGFKPLLFGQAFYGRRGFTYDFGSVNNLVAAMSGRIPGTLSFDEYQKFQHFLGILFVQHLVPVKESGVLSLEVKLGLQHIGNNTKSQPHAPLWTWAPSPLLKRRLRKLFNNPRSLARNALRKLKTQGLHMQIK